MVPIVGISNIVVIFIFLGFWTMSFAIMYHLTRFGIGTLPKRLAALFLIGSIILFATAVTLYQKLNIPALIS